MSRLIEMRILGRFTRSRMCVGIVLMMLMAPVTLRATEPTMQFDIKAEPLSEALMAFGARTGTIVIASSKLTTNKFSHPVFGQLSRQEALTKMLKETGLTFESSADGTILIVRARSGVR